MAKYKLTSIGVINQETGGCIPNTPGNRHWREYQEWLAEGYIPDPEFTEAELEGKAFQAQLDLINQSYMDETNAPVEITVEGITYTMDGKEDSARRFNEAIILAERSNETMIPMVDYYNFPHMVTPEIAKAVNLQQALYYRGVYMKRAMARGQLLASKE